MANCRSYLKKIRAKVDEQVKFMSRGPGYNLYLTPNEAELTLKKGGAKAKTMRNHPTHPGPVGAPDPDVSLADMTTVRMKLVGGNKRAKVTGLVVVVK